MSTKLLRSYTAVSQSAAQQSRQPGLQPMAHYRAIVGPAPSAANIEQPRILLCLAATSTGCTTLCASVLVGLALVGLQLVGSVLMGIILTIVGPHTWQGTRKQLMLPLPTPVAEGM